MKQSADEASVWGLFLWFGGFILASNSVATQYTAYRFNFSEGLGQPLFLKIYSPFNWAVWASHHYDRYPSIFHSTYALLSVCLVLSFGGLFGWKAFQRRPSKGIHNLHGSATFATRKDIEETGLFSAKQVGVYVGGWQDESGRLHYLKHNGPEHVLTFAPTRSGKGVSLVIPTLLSWMHSAVILDIKGENWGLTAGWRRRYAKNLVLKFDPSSPNDSVRFNPLEEIRLGTEYEVSDVQNLVTMIVDPDGRGLNDHWAKTGHALLVGAVLHCLYQSQELAQTATLRDVADLLSDPSREIEAVFKEMLETKHTKQGTHPTIAASARDMLNKADNERSGVLSTAMSFLTLYRDPIVDKNTSSSDFKIRDLMHHSRPVSLYLVIRPSDKDRLKPLIRLMLNQIIRRLTEKMTTGSEADHYKHRLLLMIDEFPSLGRLEIFQEALAFIAGYGLKAYLITQDLTQLYNAYGREESILSNCHIRIAFAPNKIETARLLSDMTGTTTIIKKTVSTSGKRFSASLNHVSESYQEIKRPLMTPDECMRLPGPKKTAEGKIKDAGDMLVFVAGYQPIYGKQPLFFKDPTFLERSKVAAPEFSDVISDYD